MLEPQDQDRFIHVIDLEKCPLNEGVFVECAGRNFAVFRLTDPPGVYVMDNSCPHASGNLSEGAVKDGIVRCPSHGWKFHVCDGRSAQQGSVARVKTYPVEIRGTGVFSQI